MSNAASFIRTSVPQANVPDIGSKVSDDFMKAFTTARDMRRQKEIDELNKKRTLQLLDLEAQMMPLKIQEGDIALKRARRGLREGEIDFKQKERDFNEEETFWNSGGDPNTFKSGRPNRFGSFVDDIDAQKKNSDGIKLSNYGYDSDSSPDHNSNVLKIGHANNKLEDGVSAALTKSLAERHGLKSGDMFEATLADGTTITRRYDDTVPTTYKGNPLPETVDLYNQSGSNNFGGKVISIKPAGQMKNTTAKRDNSDLDLPEGPFELDELDYGVLPPRGAI